MVRAGCGAVGPVTLSVTRILEKSFRMAEDFSGLAHLIEKSMFFVYILEAAESKRYYIGQTENLEERVNRHNQGKNL